MPPILTSTKSGARKPGPQGTFVARQPILSKDEKVFGYELLFRDGVENYFTSTNADAASRSTLDSSMLMGLDVLCNGSRAFINCTRDMLLKDYITLLPPATPWPRFWKVSQPTIWSCPPASGSKKVDT